VHDVVIVGGGIAGASLAYFLAERAGWAQVVRADGRRGWIERDAIATVTD